MVLRCPKCKSSRAVYLNSIAGAHYIKCGICFWQSEDYKSEKECIESVFNIPIQEVIRDGDM